MSEEVHLIYEYRPFMEMLIAHVKHDSEAKAGDTLVCIACGTAYTRTYYDFHQLCDSCFNEFDSQKMRGRDAYLKKDPIDYNEDAVKWVERKKKI